MYDHQEKLKSNKLLANNKKNCCHQKYLRNVSPPQMVFCPNSSYFINCPKSYNGVIGGPFLFRKLVEWHIRTPQISLFFSQKWQNYMRIKETFKIYFNDCFCRHGLLLCLTPLTTFLVFKLISSPLLNDMFKSGKRILLIG